MRIWLSALLVVVALGTIIFSTSRIVAMLVAVPDKLETQSYSIEVAAMQLKASVRELGRELKDLALTPTPLAMRRYERRSATLDQAISADLQSLSDQSPTIASFRSDMRNSLNLLQGARARMLGAVWSGDSGSVFTIYNSDIVTELGYADVLLTNLILHARRRGVEMRAEAAHLYTLAHRQNAAAVLVAICILLLSARHLVRALVRPTRDISNAMSSLADGNLGTHIPHTERGDEIGEMARAANVFREQSIAMRDQKIDSITGLPLRSAMVDEIEQMRKNISSRSVGASVLHIDIDRFSDVNESFDRGLGDRLLVQIANILRTMAEPHDLIVREGSDSFVWLRAGRKERSSPEHGADEFQQRLAAPMSSDRNDFRVTCSVGIANLDPSNPANTTLLNAESALKESQRQGASSITTYTAEMGDRLRRRRALLKALKFGLERDEIIPFYQPQVIAATGQLVGFEALVRWNHPEQGIITPWEFLGIAESAGMMNRITETMTDAALGQLAAWRRQGFEVPRMSLNIAASDLARPDFADRMLLAVERHGLAGRDVCIEVLESAVIEDATDPIILTLRRLRDAGFAVELDDFGTCHAAISSLRLISLNGIKIDRSFVTDIHKRSNQRMLITAILRMASALNIPVVAEGVERTEERAVLLSLGCQILQGFGIGRPMSAEATTTWLARFSPEIGRMQTRQTA